MTSSRGGLADAVSVFTASFWASLEPEKVHLTVSQWADQYRMLSSRASAEPGPWRTSRTPYLREPMDTLSPSHPCEKVVLKFGSQLGKSECGFNWIGAVIDLAPGPMLMVQPNEDMVRKVVRQRLDPAINDTPVLKEKVADGKGRDAANSMVTKDFPGGTLMMAWATSPAGLASMPIRYLFLDEIDRYPGDVAGEGDPVNLAEARTRTFANRKMLYTSTPTISGHSRIEGAFEQSDQRHYYVPCPHCGHRQTLLWENLKFEEHAPEDAAYACAGCGVLIDESAKTRMLAEGEWRAHAPENKGVRGYFLNSLYSPLGWYKWGAIAADFLKAKDKPSELKTFINTVLAEVWVEKGDAPEWERLYERRESYPLGVVPERALVLTAGVDVQKDRLEVHVWGWGETLERWVVDRLILEGNPAQDAVWDALTKTLQSDWPHALGGHVQIMHSCVDSGGHFTQECYAWKRKKAPMNATIIKGDDKCAGLVGSPSWVDVSHNGKKIKRGLQIRPVGVSQAKMELYNKIRLPVPVTEAGETWPAGFVHLSSGLDAEFCKQLVAEQLVTVKNRKGYSTRQWQQTRDRNEALDCANYARAAAYIIGVDRWKAQDWEKLRASIASKAIPAEHRPEAPKPSRSGRRVRYRVSV